TARPEALIDMVLNAARAIDLNAHAADEGGLVAGQVQGGVGHVQRGGKAPQRNGGTELGLALFGERPARELGRQPGVGIEHRVDAVHADVVGAELGGQRLAGRDDRSLGAVVPGQARARAHTGGRGDVDEAATLVGAKHRHGVYGGEIDALDVDGVALVELVLADLQRRAVAVRPARVVDHHVEPAVALHGCIDERLYVGGLRDVGGEERGSAAGLHDLVDDLFTRRRVDVIDDDLGPLGRQPLCKALANAAAGAGDDDGFVFNAHAVNLL